MPKNVTAKFAYSENTRSKVIKNAIDFSQNRF